MCKSMMWRAGPRKILLTTSHDASNSRIEGSKYMSTTWPARAGNRLLATSKDAVQPKSRGFKMCMNDVASNVNICRNLTHHCIYHKCSNPPTHH